MEIILGCDIVFASKTALLGDSHANYGLLPGAGASVRLSRRLGANNAKYLFFSGALVAVDDPMFAPLVTRIVEPSTLDLEVDDLAKQISSKSASGLREMKTLANAAFDQTLAEGLAAEQAANNRHTTSHDMNEGLAAFNERRRPIFAGR